jgi:gentisate 1,2-dioxygenase
MDESTAPPFDDICDFRKVMAELEIAEPRPRALPHIWKWGDIRRRLTAADAFDLAKIHRRAFALCNPGLRGRPAVATTLFASISVYYPGDHAPVHRHTPSASRFALEGHGGYTNVAGEKLVMTRGDLVITPNGEWHDHGNDGDEPVFWVDILDAPLIEHVNGIMTEWDYYERDPASNSGEPVKRATQSVSRPRDYSQALFSGAGIVARSAGEGRVGRRFTPKYMYRAAEMRRAQDLLRGEPGSPYDGVLLEYTDPVGGGSVVPTLSFRSQLLRPGEVTRRRRRTASAVYCVLEGSGVTEAAGRRIEWSRNDVFVVPAWVWHRHENADPRADAVLYSVSDEPALAKLGVFRDQGMREDGTIEDIAPWPDFEFPSGFSPTSAKFGPSAP